MVQIFKLGKHNLLYKKNLTKFKLKVQIASAINLPFYLISIFFNRNSYKEGESYRVYSMGRRRSSLTKIQTLRVKYFSMKIM